MATLGHEVIGIDTDKAKIDALAAGEAPFYEPGLPELLAEALATGRLRFSSDVADIRGSAVHFICVGTPQLPGEIAADLSYVDSSVASILPHLSTGDLVVGKSTVPVGTAEHLTTVLDDASTGALLAWNPEFLREGHAVKDTLHPDRLVYGVPVGVEGGDRAVNLLDEIYAATIADKIPRLVTDLATAQLVKVAANSFLATKISFINAMAELCEATGADVSVLADAIGHDERIGRKFLNAGLGFGGGCLPKDIRAFMARAGELGADQTLAFLHEVDAINNRRRIRMVEIARDECGGSISGLRVAVLGASFKPNSDDVRDSPALDIATTLHRQGVPVRVYDPAALESARRVRPELAYTSTLHDACQDADVTLVLTEWAEFSGVDPVSLADVVRRPVVVDGRLVLDADKWRAAGWRVHALGRGPRSAPA